MENVVEILKEHEAEMATRFSVRKIGVFGSHARGEQGPDSDVDILVEFERVSFDNYMDLLYYLDELLGASVDLVTVGGISPYLKEHVEKEVVWCEQGA
jgi:predicted nucleotidyltransferase